MDRKRKANIGFCSVVVQKLSFCDVVDDDGDGGVSDVGGDERAEALLPRRVPQLQPHRPVLQVHRLRQEIDADRRLQIHVRGPQCWRSDVCSNESEG